VLAWVREQGPAYGAGRGPVFVAGNSAGGYLAAFTALTPGRRDLQRRRARRGARTRLELFARYVKPFPSFRFGTSFAAAQRANTTGHRAGLADESAVDGVAESDRPVGEEPLTVEAHAAARGHVAYVRARDAWSGTPHVDAVHVCTDWLDEKVETD
jgi:carboxylesterase type B